MPNFIQADRKTDYLLPPSVDDWLNEDHLARFVVEVIDQLDLSKLTRQYAGRGSKAHHPATLLAILVYGYATGVFSSRRLERATYDSVAFRYIAAGTHPDHDTLATFRRRFLDELAGLFVQVLELAQEMKLLKLGTVCLDGTKIHANASRHSALSHGHIEKLEVQLKAEVRELFALAEQADQANVPDGVSLPEEIKRREDRLAAMAAAKVKIAARAEERYQREKAEYDEKMATRTAKEKDSGKKPGGKPPQAPTPGPKDILGARCVEPLDFAHKRVRINQLPKNKLQQSLVVPGIHQRFGNVPQFRKASIGTYHLSLFINRKDSIGRRFENARQLELTQLQPALGLFAVGDVTHKGAEKKLVVSPELRDRQLYRKFRSVLAHRREFRALADDRSFATLKKTEHPPAMRFTQRRQDDQSGQVLAQRLGTGIAKHLLRTGAPLCNRAAAGHADHRIHG